MKESGVNKTKGPVRFCNCGRLVVRRERYRLTRRRMLEIECYYSPNDLNIWECEFNIPPREMAPIILVQKGSWSHCGFCLETVLAEQSISLLREVAAGIGSPSTCPGKPSAMAERSVVRLYEEQIISHDQDGTGESFTYSYYQHKCADIGNRRSSRCCSQHRASLS